MFENSTPEKSAISPLFVAFFKNPCFCVCAAFLELIQVGNEKETKLSEKPEPKTGWRCVGISSFDGLTGICQVCLRVPSIRVADRLADPQGEEALVAGVCQRVDGLREHAGRSSVDPRQEFEEEV